MGKPRSHPELGRQGQKALYSFQLKNRQQILREKLTWIVTGLGLGVMATAAVILVSPRVNSLFPLQRSSSPTAEDPLQQGLQFGMRAAELTQSADLREDWVEVAMLWQNAIAQLKTVLPTSVDHSQAQQKIAEYQRNLTYAETNVTSRPARQPHSQDYWTLGSDREQVLATEGMPDQIRQISSSCYETLHYSNSIVELQNGYVYSYDNFDSNLKVLEVGDTALSTHGDERHWTLGSTKESVIKLQGTPDRTSDFQSQQFTTLYYDDSFVLFDQDRVIGYLNRDNNLKVSIRPAVTDGPPAQSWTIGSSRLQVLQAQGQSPSAVSRRDGACEEIFYFGNSEVYFHQGTVQGYRNLDKNLTLR